MTRFTIRPFAIAYGPQREKSRFTYMNYYGEQVDIIYYVWVLEGSDRNIIVDTGCTARQFRVQIKGEDEAEGLQGSGETFRDVVDVQGIEEALGRCGLKPEDIDLVLMTHLHWDHCMNMDKFPNATFYVQEAEIKGAYQHPAIMNFAYAPRQVYDRMRNLEIVNGDFEVTPGLKLLFTPCHSPGGQSVSVQTEKGRYVIPAFCTINENFYPPPELVEKIGYPVIPPAVHGDSEQAYEMTLRLVQTHDRVLANHDPCHMKVERYPE